MRRVRAWGRPWGHKHVKDAAGRAPKEETTPDSMATPDSLATPDMRQSIWHGRFLELHHEIAYQRWHSAKWIPRLQLVMTICGFFGLLAFFMGVRGGVALKASLMRAYPDRAWLLIVTRILGALVPVLGATALCFTRARGVIVARRLYQGVPLTVFMTFAILEACPIVWLAAQHVNRSSASTKAPHWATAKAQLDTRPRQSVASPAGTTPLVRLG